MARDIMQQANKQVFTKLYLPKFSGWQSFPLPNVTLYGIYNAVWRLVPLKSGHTPIFYAHTVIMQYTHNGIAYLIGNYKGKEVNRGK